MKTIKTLFIEDEKLLSSLFEDAVTAWKDEYPEYDFVSDAALDLKSSLQYLDEQPAPDVIVLDLRLPAGEAHETTEVPEKENGFIILKRIKSDEKFKNTPVIVFTNLSDDETRKESKTLGADRFMTKSKALPADLLKAVVEVSKGV